MRKIVAVKVEFEALGQNQVAYTDKIDLEYITKVIKMITPTAHLVCVSTDLVEASIYKKQNVDRIIYIHNKYVEEYKESWIVHTHNTSQLRSNCMI